MFAPTISRSTYAHPEEAHGYRIGVDAGDSNARRCVSTTGEDRGYHERPSRCLVHATRLDCDWRDRVDSHCRADLDGGPRPRYDGREVACRAGSLSWAPRNPQLHPRHFTRLDHAAYLPLPLGQCTAASFDFQKHHPLYLARCEAVEHHEIHGTAQKTRVLGIEAELRQIGHQLFVHLARCHGEAAL